MDFLQSPSALHLILKCPAACSTAAATAGLHSGLQGTAGKVQTDPQSMSEQSYSSGLQCYSGGLANSTLGNQSGSLWSSVYCNSFSPCLQVLDLLHYNKSGLLCIIKLELSILRLELVIQRTLPLLLHLVPSNQIQTVFWLTKLISSTL